MVNNDTMFTTASTTKVACTLYPYHEERCQVVLALHRTFSSLSLIGCALVTFLIVVMKMYKLFVQKMVLALAISGFFDSISYMVGNMDTRNEDHACRFQSIMMQFFDWAVLMWIVMITINMLLIVRNKNNVRFFYLFHGVVWPVCLLMTLIPIFGKAYGPAGLWCWISREHTNYRFGTWYGPHLGIMVILVVLYSYIIYYVIQATKPEGSQSVEMQNLNKRYRKEVKPVIWYPIIYILLLIPPLMYRIEDASHPSKPPNYGLILISAVCGPSVGAVSAIIFTVSSIRLNQLDWKNFKINFLNIFKFKNEADVIHDYKVPDAPTSSVHYSVNNQPMEMYST